MIRLFILSDCYLINLNHFKSLFFSTNSFNCSPSVLPLFLSYKKPTCIWNRKFCLRISSIYRLYLDTSLSARIVRRWTFASLKKALKPGRKTSLYCFTSFLNAFILSFFSVTLYCLLSVSYLSKLEIRNFFIPLIKLIMSLHLPYENIFISCLRSNSMNKTDYLMSGVVVDHCILL